ncbi:MAG: AMP-binding protein [Candidatus Sericytochromatia bacterium]|nr:AMP-binding protein [Candidatus Sericytochromatia bacterium]
MPTTDANIYHATLLGPAIRDDRVALWHLPPGATTEEGLTFAALRQEAGRVAAWLRAHGVSPGDRVLLLLPMSPAFYAAVLGVAQVGAVAVFADPAAGLSQLGTAVHQARPGAVVGVRGARWLRWLVPAVRRIPLALWVEAHRPLLPGHPADLRVEPVEADTPVAIVHTTGSTGAPKAVLRTHGYIAAMLRALDMHPSKHREAVDMPLWPMLAFDALCHGRSCVLPALPGGRLDRLEARTLLAQIRRRGVTLLVGPPVAIETLCRAAEEGEGVGSLRHVFVGGALVPPALLSRVQRLLPEGEALAVYGSTEADPVAVHSAREAEGLAPRAGVCVGRPHPDLRVRLVVPTPGPVTWADCLDVPPGDVGEVMVAGPHVNVHYHDDPESLAAYKVVDPDGATWHRMGDLAACDEAGRLWLQGRVATRVQTAAGVLDSLDVEARAVQVPGVRAAALLGRAGEAWVVVEPAEDADLHDVEQQVAAVLAGTPPVRVVFHPALPRDARHHSRVDLAALTEDLPDDPPRLPPRAAPPRLWQRAYAYLAERFPLGKNVLGVVLMVGTDGLATLALLQAPFTGQVWQRLGVMVVLFTLLFFHLRVFDEHKDWKVDRIAFPERVLSRGWVSLTQLRAAAWLAVVLELGIGAATSPAVLGWMLVLIGYTWLMLREFYVGEWLNRHMVLYGVSHMAIITLMSVAVYAAVLDVGSASVFGLDRTLGGWLPGWFARLWHPGLLLFAGMNFCFIYSLEVARKIRVPEQERPQVDTYSRRLGLAGALMLVIATQALGLVLLGIAGPALHVHASVYWLGAGALALVATAFGLFARKPRAEMAKRLESVGALTVLLVNVALLITWGGTR